MAPWGIKIPRRGVIIDINASVPPCERWCVFLVPEHESILFKLEPLYRLSRVRNVKVANACMDTPR